MASGTAGLLSVLAHDGLNVVPAGVAGLLLVSKQNGVTMFAVNLEDKYVNLSQQDNLLHCLLL